MGRAPAAGRGAHSLQVRYRHGVPVAPEGTVFLAGAGITACSKHPPDFRPAMNQAKLAAAWARPVIRARPPFRHGKAVASGRSVQARSRVSRRARYGFAGRLT